MALQGTLDTFALSDVLRLLASTKKTGRLVIAGNRGTGSVWVDGGSVVGYDATGTVEGAAGADVLFELLRYTDGSFTFESGTTTTDLKPPQAVEVLLADAERQVIEWRAIEAVVPSMEAWLSLVAEIEDGEIMMSANTWMTIVAIGSGTTVTAVGHALKLGELDVCRRVKEVVEQGLVKVSTAPTPTLRPLEDTIEIPGVDPIIAPEPEWQATAGIEHGSNGNGSDADPVIAHDTTAEGVPESFLEDDHSDDDDDVVEDRAEADEVAKQLASLSPKAAQAVAAASRTRTGNGSDAMNDELDDDDEPVNRGLLLKFLSSVKT